MVPPMKFKREDFFSLPNILTYIRILLVPLFCVVYCNATTISDHIWSIVIVLISAATDILDGYIARNWNMITDWGKIIDPIADKAMQAAIMFCIVIKYHWVGILIGLYAIKEITSLCLSAYLFKKGKHIDGAKWYGKVCTVILYITLLSYIVIPNIPPMYNGILIGECSTFIVIAFGLYMNDYITLYAELKKEQKEGTYEAPGQMFYISKKSVEALKQEEEGLQGENKDSEESPSSVKNDVKQDSENDGNITQ